LTQIIQKTQTKNMENKTRDASFSWMS
jgi:hypothetical protein